ncbi:hypothetical protein [Paraflavitalea speifideaquila]|uniref:hypothetical protein n=1 Tax=Paraflavitalea speifideaquila TaxID=3076558 RepID=UPI0028E3FBD3|nr:hypothetical protein [Paraflavitalea speifideiaquila]
MYHSRTGSGQQPGICRTKDIKALGTNTVYIDKWEYADGGNDYPWWKYVKRPDPAYDEMIMLKKKVPGAANVAFNISTTNTLEVGDNSISGVNYYGVTDEFSIYSPLKYKWAVICSRPTLIMAPTYL